MKSKYFFVILVCSTIASCVNFTYSRKELVDKGKVSGSVCSGEDLSITEPRFDDYFKKCFKNMKIVVNGANVAAQYLVTKSKLGGEIWYTVTTPIMYKPAYMLAVDLKESTESESCKTAIQGYAFNKMWEEHFNNFKAIASGSETKCPAK